MLIYISLHICIFYLSEEDQESEKFDSPDQHSNTSKVTKRP